MFKIFIIGSKGYFGANFVDFFNKKGWEVLTDRLDIRDYSAVKKFLTEKKPAVVLNAAGKTGTPNVDWCESHKSETMSVNVAGAINITCVCAELGIYFVQIGSGCIYEGNNSGQGFSEEDPPNFFGSFYSRTKILSENALKEFNVLQLRVRIPVEGRSHPKNVIDKLVKYNKIISVENSFTVVEDFLPATYELIQKRQTGIFNMTNPGATNHRFIMEHYTKIVDPKKTFTYMTLDELAKITTAPRSNCVLKTDKLEKLGIKMPEIKKRIPEIMEKYKENKNGF